MSRGISHLKVRESGLCLIDHSRRHFHAQHWNNSFLENDLFVFPSPVTQLFFYLSDFVSVCLCVCVSVIMPVGVLGWEWPMVEMENESPCTNMQPGKKSHGCPCDLHDWDFLCIALSLPIFQTHTNTDTQIHKMLPLYFLPHLLGDFWETDFFAAKKFWLSETSTSTSNIIHFNLPWMFITT